MTRKSQLQTMQEHRAGVMERLRVLEIEPGQTARSQQALQNLRGHVGARLAHELREERKAGLDVLFFIIRRVGLGLYGHGGVTPLLAFKREAAKISNEHIGMPSVDELRSLRDFFGKLAVDFGPRGALAKRRRAKAKNG